MKHINKCILLGNAGGVPAVHQFQAGTGSIATVGLATNRYNKKEDGNWETFTTWHQLVFPPNKVETAMKIKKGDVIYVEGEIKYKEYDNKDGIRQKAVEIKVFDFSVMSKGDDVNGKDTAPIAKKEVEDYYEDVPF